MYPIILASRGRGRGGQPGRGGTAGRGGSFPEKYTGGRGRGGL